MLHRLAFLRRIGEQILKNSERLGEAVALSAMRDSLLQSVTQRSDFTEEMLGPAQDRVSFDTAWSYVWAKSAFPQIVMSHRLAASLAATVVPPELIADVIIPWNALAIVLPVGLLEWADANEQPASGTQILVEHVNGRLRVVLEADDATRVFNAVLWDSLASVSDLAEPVDLSLWLRSQDEDDTRPSMARALTLAKRIVLGACIELDQEAHRIVIGQGRPKEKRRRAGEPTSWTFKLSREVKVDCRAWVVQYLRGGRGTSPGVQTLVRGHHKRQVHGPGRSLRKWIHIEPYWRGPEHAPIAVRPHKLG